MPRIIALIALTLCLATVSQSSGGPVAPGSTVEGKTIGEWTADWWNWAGSVPNVFSDTTGAQATVNQSGPVFFVAGSTVGVPPVTRSFDVPQGKYVLFPLLNWIVANGPDPGFSSTAEEVEALTTGTIDPAQLFATVNGAAIPNLEQYRERSPIDFTFTPTTPSAGFPPGTYTDANSDGYWIMLEPLEPGTHTLHFGGTSLDYVGPDPIITVDSFTVDVTANLTVDGEVVIPLPPAALSAFPVLAAAWGSMQWRRRHRSAR